MEQDLVIGEIIVGRKEPSGFIAYVGLIVLDGVEAPIGIGIVAKAHHVEKRNDRSTDQTSPTGIARPQAENLRQATERPTPREIAHLVNIVREKERRTADGALRLATQSAKLALPLDGGNHPLEIVIHNGPVSHAEPLLQ